MPGPVHEGVMNKKAVSLVEIIISSIILTIVFAGGLCFVHCCS